jgi:hypothetical protein
MKKKFIPFLFFFFITALSAKISAYKIAPGHVVDISLKDACSLMGVQNNLLLIEADNKYLDCMGKKFNLNILCQKRRPETFPIDLIQAVYSKEKDTIECRFSDQVQLTIKCMGKDRWQCETPKKRCSMLQKEVAVELPLMRASLVDSQNGNGKTLHCLYQSKQQDQIVHKDEKSFEAFLKSL